MAFVIPVVAFRTLLLGSADIVAFFAPDAPRIYGSPGIPRADVNSMPRSAITLLQLGGTQNRDIPIGDPAIAVRFYGATSMRAMELFATVDGFLGDMAAPVAGRRIQNRIVTYGTDQCYIYAIHKSTGPMDVMEPGEDWPFVWASYRMKYWQRPV